MESVSQTVADWLYLLWAAIQEDSYTLLIYVVPIALSWFIYRWLTARQNARGTAALVKSRAAGLSEPVSLHPIIDPNICLGCGACVKVCPEGDILGIVHEKAYLIHPTHCIGHGACKTACPTNAISLVLGSQERGVDIPLLKPNFETNVPAIFVAGELGGMGLIRNAIEQGKQAMISILKTVKAIPGEAAYDVVIIGAGPAGFAASLEAKANKLRYVTLEQESLGGTVAHFPRGKIVMTAPVKLPLIGLVNFSETTKEKLIAFWQDVEQKSGITINYRERMTSIQKEPVGFNVTTERASYHTKAVLLAIGRRGTPRKLGVPGEDQNKVVYRLTDAEQYRGQQVLVVGGGNSALEAAIQIAEQPNTHVTLSYRGNAFQKANPKNVVKIEEGKHRGAIKVLLGSQIKNIGETDVHLVHNGEDFHLPNDGVIVCAGGVLPTPMLKELGIEIETRHGQPI